MSRNRKKNRSISYEDLVTDLEVKVSKSDKTENSALKKFYFLYIKSERGRSWIHMFWMSVLFLFISPLIRQIDLELYLLFIFGVIFIYVFALFSDYIYERFGIWIRLNSRRNILFTKSIIYARTIQRLSN